MNHVLTSKSDRFSQLATITSKGQLTLPVEIRRRLRLRSGDKLAVAVKGEGQIELRVPHYKDIASLQGAAGSLPRPMTWEEIEHTVADERAEAYRAKFGGPDHD